MLFMFWILLFMGCTSFAKALLISLGWIFKGGIVRRNMTCLGYTKCNLMWAQESLPGTVCTHVGYVNHKMFIWYLQYLTSNVYDNLCQCRPSFCQRASNYNLCLWHRNPISINRCHQYHSININQYQSISINPCLQLAVRHLCVLVHQTQLWILRPAIL